ncbi:inositol monophosphatase [Sphingobium sufflavum]|uniref:inositol monophosphatase family protein n=1 Tax=Sphingobium sufflavum TaxID=1129547 RepID=UPI001F32F13C|nr:inositol monophosphatase family protein [Sphingobium sufflavum]MCE7797042.1 inositol monophosphatase [Sphingobium sufflavum]
MTLLSPTQLDAVDRLLRDVARDIVMPRFQNLADHEVVEKAVDDLVTIADRESEERLAEALLDILPQSTVVGEEACAANPSVQDRIGDGAVWIIDPIDGTGNFAAGRAPFGLMVALAVEGEVRAGWMFDPLGDRMSHARLGEGAFIDGARVQSRGSGAAAPVAGISLLFMDQDKRKRTLERAGDRLTMVDIPRCAAEQYPRVVLGQNDLALFERTLPWDHAPGVLFLTEAGGTALRADGSPYRVTDRRTGLLAAATPALWDMGARILF